MAHLTITHIEELLANLPADRDHIRVETGRYKPFMPASVEAARRRGMKVESPCGGVYLIRRAPAAAVAQA
ncbi:hypothetical protein [Hydrogenophaga sp. 2FB]|uniref:hypothetical protein n=1 Tax=Hydrogenophaga sp. 2FB TaxID=2502187 RepID=UPI0010F944FC|nr:hypothetical protein [Hydrogenophaga sp. 2FB]